MNSFVIPVPQEFSFDLCLTYLKRSPHELLHFCEENEVVKLLKVNSEHVLFRVRAKDESHLEVDVLHGNIHSTNQAFLTSYIREWFDLETDLKLFYEMASADRILKSLVKKFYGYRIVGQPDLFESLTWAVLGQQINLNFAYLMKRRFVESFGERFECNGNAYYLFPSASTIVSLTHNDLLPLQFSRQKSSYVVAIAEAFTAGHISKEKLATLPFDEAKEKLMGIKGIGNWTANYVLMKTFRHRDAFPLEDAGLRNALRNHLKLDRKPTLDEIRKVFRNYKGWEAYATLYLWKSL